ncbi:MAG: MinD/ParA family protein [Deltaproteobacteria bacterium]|jgi:flagellar biosynthesis protein FlhG|nr:MinD/ParA family protein [Deltaproteobacteria bacterium]
MTTSMPLVFSITSGKGGVGKTNLAVNLACCLAKAKKRVLLLDADLGLANVDVIMGITPPYNLFHLFHEGVALDNILYATDYGFKILPAASGVSEMLALTPGQKSSLLESMDGLEEALDYLIVDTGAGINDNVLYFNLAAQQRIVVLTPEPTSLTDAYALIKLMRQNHRVSHFKILVNMAQDEKAAKEVYTRLYKACDHFLTGVSLDFVGFVPRDAAVRNSVINQKPFCIDAPASPASKALTTVAKAIQTWDVPSSLDGNIKFFWKRLLFRQ